MLNKINWNYVLFSCSLLAFILTTVSTMYFYSHLDEKIDTSQVAVEVSLPVINWAQYDSVSRKAGVDLQKLVR
ncbi:MAG: hypothetical protein WC846_04115 [Candidatus Gracilibacteria bacterium]|jgi:hypothetical protein